MRMKMRQKRIRAKGKIEDGKRKAENGRWKMEDGSRRYQGK
jgi:hypothetical protein